MWHSQAGGSEFSVFYFAINLIKYRVISVWTKEIIWIFIEA